MSILRKDYRHSASRGNAFVDSPAYWIITELYNYEEKPNARMVMGLAAEKGAIIGLDGGSKKDILRATSKEFDSLYKEECDEVIMAVEIAYRFTESLKEFGKVVSYQNEKIYEDNKLKYPIKCITDFEFNDCIIDTKATAYLKRLKSGKLDGNWYPKASDVRQQYLYKRIYNKPTMLLYTSPKDQEIVDMVDRIPDVDLLQVFQTIEHICNIAKSKDEVVKMFPLTMDNFRWGKDETEAKKFARDVWNKVWKQ